MKLNKDGQLFFGCKIDSKLREGLSMARPGDRKYFEDPKSEFLRLCMFDDERWIGKVMKGGLNANDVEDVQRNIISILRRIAPNVRTSPSSIKIFHVTPTDEVITFRRPHPDAENDSQEGGGSGGSGSGGGAGGSGGDSSGGGAGGGPYIDY